MLIPFTQVDAFASVPHEGNPAAAGRLASGRHAAGDRGRKQSERNRFHRSDIR